MQQKHPSSAKPIAANKNLWLQPKEVKATPGGKRWYEHHPVIRDGVEAWHRFPPQLQQAVGVYLIHKLKRDGLHKTRLNRRQDGLPKHFTWLRSLKKRRRWYDQNAAVRSAFFILGQLSQEHLIVICEKLVMLKVYLSRHQEALKTTQDKELVALVDHVFSINSSRFFQHYGR